jgi:hypothetical protein
VSLMDALGEVLRTYAPFGLFLVVCAVLTVVGELALAWWQKRGGDQ